MTRKQALGFEITKVLLDEHNQAIKTIGERFFKKFDEVFKILSKKGYKATDFEDVLYEYIDMIKEEYYKAGQVINDIVENSEIKDCLEDLTA